MIHTNELERKTKLLSEMRLPLPFIAREQRFHLGRSGTLTNYSTMLGQWIALGFVDTEKYPSRLKKAQAEIGHSTKR